MEVDRHYEPPASEAGACKPVRRDTQWKSARSGTIFSSRRLSRPLRGVAVRTSPTVSSRPGLLPSHIPSGGLLVGSTRPGARAPLLIFRKIHLYGKTKKSTHDHQTAKPYCTHFPHASSEYITERCGSNGGGLASWRGLWRA